MSSREQVSPVAPPVPSLARSAIGGVTWNYAGSAVLVVAQVASTAVTARLVSPSQFGAYATAQVAAGVMGYFTLTALGNGLLRRSELDGKAIGTAVWLSLIASALVAGAMALLAAPWAGLWGINSAATLVRVLAATLFLLSLIHI